MAILSRRNFFRGALVPAACLAGLEACGSSAGAQLSTTQNLTTPPVSPPPPVNRGVSSDPPIFAIEAADIANIVLRPEAFYTIYQALAPNGNPADFVRQKLGPAFGSLDDSACLAIFATAVAFNIAPSGDSNIAPMDATLDQIVHSPSLTCGHYCKLTTILTLLRYPTLIPPDDAAGINAKGTIHFIVWLATVPLNVGIHSQLILTNAIPDAYLLLDPLYGIALRIPFGSSAPDTSLTAIENATLMLKAPIDAGNLAVLDPRGIASNPALVPALTGGLLSPDYIYHDSLYGSEGWDNHVAQTFRGIS